MFVATVVMAFTTGVGVVFVWLTLRENRRIGEAQTRAYVQVDRATFEWDTPHHTDAYVRLWVKNSGQTPAKWFQFRLKSIVYDPNGDDYPDEWPSHMGEFSRKWFGIGSESENDFREPIFSTQLSLLASFAAVLGNENARGLIILGEIRYCTFFGEVFVSQFAVGQSVIWPYRRNEDKKKIPQKLSRMSVGFPLDSYKFEGWEEDFD